jgi:hypothetical protein
MIADCCRSLSYSRAEALLLIAKMIVPIRFALI